MEEHGQRFDLALLPKEASICTYTSDSQEEELVTSAFTDEVALYIEVEGHHARVRGNQVATIKALILNRDVAVGVA